MEYGFREKKFYNVIYHVIFEPGTFFGIVMIGKL